jgi:hypothetical protein
MTVRRAGRMARSRSCPRRDRRGWRDGRPTRPSKRACRRALMTVEYGLGSAVQHDRCGTANRFGRRHDCAVEVVDVVLVGPRGDRARSLRRVGGEVDNGAALQGIDRAIEDRPRGVVVDHAGDHERTRPGRLGDGLCAHRSLCDQRVGFGGCAVPNRRSVSVREKRSGERRAHRAQACGSENCPSGSESANGRCATTRSRPPAAVTAAERVPRVQRCRRADGASHTNPSVGGAGHLSHRRGAAVHGRRR